MRLAPYERRRLQCKGARKFGSKGRIHHTDVEIWAAALPNPGEDLAHEALSVGGGAAVAVRAAIGLC
eukprot:COSAG03_NODE_10113_length_671_cov_1.636364_1_plen_67_part_00